MLGLGFVVVNKSNKIAFGISDRRCVLGQCFAAVPGSRYRDRGVAANSEVAAFADSR